MGSVVLKKERHDINFVDFKPLRAYLTILLVLFYSLRYKAI